MHTFAFLGMPGGWEWIVILLIGLLLFGRRLPEVGRSLGRGIVEFKKGVKGIEDEVSTASDEPRYNAPRKELPPERPAEPVRADERAVSKSDAV